MRTYLTSAQLEALTRFAEDDRQPLDTEAAEALSQLNAAVQKNIIKLLNGTRKRNTLLAERLEKFTDRKHEKILSGEFAETALDSPDVAKALLYQLNQYKTYRLSIYKVSAILYEMYASWLHSKNERLFIEHPVATEYGPRFWRVFNHVDMKKDGRYEDYKALAEKNPGVAAFCKNAAAKYYDISEKDLTDVFRKTKAYLIADASHNGGKWNKPIDDKEIWQWKERQSKNINEPER